MSGIVTDTTPWKKLPQAMREEIRLTLLMLSTQLEGTLRQMIRDEGGIYMGTMVGGISSQVRPAGAGVYRMMVGTPVEHGQYYEFGTKAHWPPFEPIRRWVEFKVQPHVFSMGVEFSTGKALPTGTARKLRGAKRDQAIIRVAKAIQARIGRSGTKAHRVMQHALELLGAPYRVEKEGADYIYQVDVAGWLQKRGEDLWKRILTNLPKS